MASSLGKKPTTALLLRSPLHQWLKSEICLDKGLTVHPSSPLLFLSNHCATTDATISNGRPGSTPPAPSRLEKHLERTCQQVYATCSQQLGWRCVPAMVGTGFAFSTADELSSLMDLSSRTGAATTLLAPPLSASAHISAVAVGSSAAMHMAKAVMAISVTKRNDNNSATTTAAVAAPLQLLVMVPLTYDAVWASTTSHVLQARYDATPDPLLLVLGGGGICSKYDDGDCQDQRSAERNELVLLEPTLLLDRPISDRVAAYHAAVALALDAMIVSGENHNGEDEYNDVEKLWRPILLQWIKQQQQQSTTNTMTSDAGRKSSGVTAVIDTMQALADMGGTTSFGLDPPTRRRQRRRSIPLAVAAALLPQLARMHHLQQLSFKPSAVKSNNKKAFPLLLSEGSLLLHIMASLVPGLHRHACDDERKSSGGSNSQTIIRENLIALLDKKSEQDLGALSSAKEVINKNSNAGSTESPSSLWSLLSPWWSERCGGSSCSGTDNDRLALADAVQELVQENRDEWDCLDVDDDSLETILHDSLQISR